MSTLPEELNDYYANSLKAFYTHISDLKRQFPETKKQFLAISFTPYANAGSNDEKAAFILQFTHWIPQLVFFPDQEILEKLKKLKFSWIILRWFVDIDEIKSEIERLASIDGLYQPWDSVLLAIQYHLICSVHIDMIEAFELGIVHNKLETNILHKEAENIFRKREYKKKSARKSQADAVYHRFSKMIQDFEDSTQDKKTTKGIVLKPLRGDTSAYLNFLSEFISLKKSKRMIYLEMYPLLHLILKSEDLLTEEQFDERKDYAYGASYNDYKIARVKKILLRK